MSIRRWLFAVLILLLTLPAFAGRGGGGGGHRSSGGTKSVYVHGYTRKDGTYVAPHYRSAPGTAVYSSPAPAPKSTFTPEPAPRLPSTDSSVFSTTPTYSTPASSTRSVHTYSSSGAHTTHRTRITHTTRTHTYRPRTTYTTTTTGLQRDKLGHIKRSESAKHQFLKQTGYPHGRKGYVVDHIIPLCRGGADSPSNMQWQTVAEAKAKDKTECPHH